LYDARHDYDPEGLACWRVWGDWGLTGWGIGGRVCRNDLWGGDGLANHPITSESLLADTLEAAWSVDAAGVVVAVVDIFNTFVDVFTNNAVARVTRRAFTKKAAYGVDTAGNGITVVQAQFALVDIFAVNAISCEPKQTLAPEAAYGVDAPCIG
jgi:hypothetical protein